MEIIALKRKVKLEKYRGILDIGRQNEKQSYLAILKLAEENHGKITAENIIDKFFKGRPKQLGERIIFRCIYQNLFDEEGFITEEGRIALKENIVYIRENGAYDFWITGDQLIPQKLLEIKEVSIGDYNRGLKEPINIPVWIKNFEGKKIRLFSRNIETIKIYEFSNKIQKLKNDIELNVHYHIFPPGNQKKAELFLSGDLKGKFLEIPNYSYNYIWYSLLGENQNRWDRVDNTYKSYFDEIDDYSRLNFVRDLKFNHPKIDKLGHFNDVTIKNIVIKPINSEEAMKWAEWILEQRLTDYLTNNEYKSLCREIRVLKQFQEFNINFESQEIYARKFLKKTRKNEIKVLQKFWYLQTTLDLNPDNIMEEEYV